MWMRTVSEYVRFLCKEYNITYSFESCGSLEKNSLNMDGKTEFDREIKDLIIALKKADVITNIEMIKLITVNMKTDLFEDYISLLNKTVE